MSFKESIFPSLSKKLLVMILSIVALSLLSLSCNSKKKDRIVIYTVADENQMAFYQKGLSEKFPEYDISMEFVSSGSGAARVKAEGSRTAADILQTWEVSYLGLVKDNLETLSWIDNDIYMPDLVSVEKYYVPELRNSGAIVINTRVMKEKGLPYPQSYEDLLKPIYKGLVAMPNPKSSGSGYMFLRNLVNEWGEDEAFNYFNRLSENILQFTPSGTGSINLLLQNEVAISLGITAQAVNLINSGAPFEILFFKEGAPFSVYAHAIIKGRVEKKGVREVFDYLAFTLTPECDALYYPEKVYKDKDFVLKNYPNPIPYGNMENDTTEEKVRLLEKWMF